jgi:hypothetical protein
MAVYYKYALRIPMIPHVDSFVLLGRLPFVLTLYLADVELLNLLDSHHNYDPDLESVTIPLHL